VVFVTSYASILDPCYGIPIILKGYSGGYMMKDEDGVSEFIDDCIDVLQRHQGHLSDEQIQIFSETLSRFCERELELESDLYPQGV
jgi:hypothetical protein